MTPSRSQHETTRQRTPLGPPPSRSEVSGTPCRFPPSLCSLGHILPPVAENSSFVSKELKERRSSV
ncbi:hypothetical protein BGZ61DRAFT_443259 [Ilyonectria robusta]|uniref:uncharacterized protein n=1 Tax=Ilyonectria robusta TaxID=1079257 RepID=UPI001E8E4827|nr:uncharacterized protein BGZ61DRAFT_443259 [Ilyonectria robusta]KAH8734857.1 hypothetical protein BGZ61DRAFT_443259 [Ilyonectria robusta]